MVRSTCLFCHFVLTAVQGEKEGLGGKGGGEWGRGRREHTQLFGRGNGASMA